MSSKKEPTRSSTAPASSQSVDEDFDDILAKEDVIVEEPEPTDAKAADERKTRGVKAQEANENAPEGKNTTGTFQIRGGGGGQTDVKGGGGWGR